MHLGIACRCAKSLTVIPSTLKSSLRKLDKANKLFVEGSENSLKELQRLSHKRGENDELTSRVAALCAYLSLKHNNFVEVNKSLSRASCSPPIIKLSLNVLLLVETNEIDQALDVLEDILNTENEIFLSSNASISDEALDCLYEKISSSSNTSHQMKRFRKLQKLLTVYKCRSEKSLREILTSPLNTDYLTDDRHINPNIVSDKIVEETPFFLNKS